MICLGVESTAHTLGVGLITSEGRVLANQREMLKPVEGGIHPRQAAEHHAQKSREVLLRALEQANTTLEEVDLVAFSQGPGLPPALKIGATLARAVALKYGKPLVGVNHCISHLEIGRLVTKFKDPVLLYVSGANTQIIAFKQGKYRVFGETLDMGVGNFLDTFARKKGIPFPGGPVLEKLAKKGEYVKLPYTVKGMDVTFSGILSAALNKDEKLEDLAYSIQETVFAMLVEVVERAMSNTGKEELILGGGVAANNRLNEMAAKMCKQRGAKFKRVPKEFCVDNGVMIAWTGILKYNTQGPTPIEESTIIKGWRTDQERVSWVTEELVSWSNGLLGAEAKVEVKENAVVKTRVEKGYRLKQIDEEIRKQRNLREVKLLTKAKRIGVNVPKILGATDYSITMERIIGKTLNEECGVVACEKVGGMVAKLHSHEITHGDLTTTNILVTEDGELYLIDFGLANTTKRVEDYAVDIHLFKQSLKGTKGDEWVKYWGAFLNGYDWEKRSDVLQRLEVVERRGRYKK